MKRKETGITLIALVITVIVMIILAGVAINLTIGDNGIFNKTKITAEEHRGGTVEEQRDLWRADREMYQYVEGNGRKSLEELLVELRGKNLLSDEEVEIIKRDKIITIGSHVIDFTITDEIDYSKLPAGLYETGTTTLIKSWEQLKQDGDITVSGTTFTKMLEGLKGDLVISNEITIIQDGLIGHACLGKKGKITKVYIPASVEKIEPYAFACFLELREVIIEEGVKEIGANAFQACTNLEMEIPASVTKIGSEYLSLGGGVNYIKVNKDNTVYDSRNDCNAVIETATNTLKVGSSHTIIPDTVTSISGTAFSGCTGLTSLKIPASITTIESSAFSDCIGLTNLEIDKNNPVYDSRNNCNAIIETNTNTLMLGTKNTMIPDTVTNIGRSAFSGCTGLTSIEIPTSVTAIEDYAFNKCTGLTSIEIPSNITSIGISAFSGCSRLTKVKIQNGLTSIGNVAFRECTELKSIEIPANVTTIGSGAFAICTNLTTINIRKPEGSITGSPWGATNATINWNYEGE